MKPRVLLLCSVLAIGLVGLYLTSSRDQRSDPLTANSNGAGERIKEMRLERLNKLGTSDNNAAPVTTDKSQNTDESQSEEDCPASGKPFHAGDIKIVSVSHKGDYGFEYPQIANPSTPQERAFNRYILKFIAAFLKDYKKCISEEECDDYYGFFESYVTPEFVSIKFVRSFEVGIGGTRRFDTLLNYDLKAGRPVKKLADLFALKSKYLKVISKYVDSELRRCDYSPDGYAQSSWNRTKRKLADYDGWQLTLDGVEIILPSDRIGQIGYDLGVLIPYGRLEDGLRRDVEWFRRLQGNNDLQRLSK